MTEAFAAGYANPASQHRAGQIARRQLEHYRSDVIGFLGGKNSGMDADSLVFTSGGTESDNLAMFGLAATGRQRLIDAERMLPDQAARVLISSIEHPAVFAAAEQLARVGFDVHRVPVNDQGVCRIDALKELLQQPTALVSLMLANNETGVMEPVAEVANICRLHHALIHTDAVQAVGKMRVKFSELGVDALTFTAHKLAGPRGVGGLLLRYGVTPEPILFGGFQQMAIRPGTEDVALVAGLWRSLKDFEGDADRRESHLRTLRNRLQKRLLNAAPDAIVNSGSVDRTPQTLNLAFPGINRQSFLMSADMQGLAISTGSACASGSSEPSPVLMAMGLPKEVVDGSIRISVGLSNSMQEIDEAADRIEKILNRLR